MTASVADLLTLQDTDLALDGALARLSEIEDALGETEELNEARAAVEEKTAELRVLKTNQQDVELQSDEARTKASEVEKKLYSGKVTIAKEVQDLDADLKSLKEQLRRKEDELLAVLEQVDAAETELRGLEATLADIETDWKRGQEEMLAEKASLEPEVERLRAARVEQAAGIERTTISLYDLLRERRGGMAVAHVERGMCQGCRISLPTSVMQKVRAGNGVVQCVSCERILLIS